MTRHAKKNARELYAKLAADVGKVTGIKDVAEQGICWGFRGPSNAVAQSPEELRAIVDSYKAYEEASVRASLISRLVRVLAAKCELS